MLCSAVATTSSFHRYRWTPRGKGERRKAQREARACGCYSILGNERHWRREQLTPHLLIAALAKNQLAVSAAFVWPSLDSPTPSSSYRRVVLRSVIVLQEQEKSTPSKNGGFLRAAIAAKSCCQLQLFFSTHSCTVYLPIELTAGTISEPSTSILVACLHHCAIPDADCKLLLLGASILQLHAWTARAAAAAAAATTPSSA